MNLVTITIPKDFADEDELVVLPKKQFDALVARAEDTVTEEDVLEWSRDAKRLYAEGKLPELV